MTGDFDVEEGEDLATAPARAAIGAEQQLPQSR
jgi:hypothetical protein